MEELETIKPGVVRVAASYSEALEELSKQGYREITLEENALLRMQEGKDSDISKYGNRVGEDVIYIPKKGTFLTKNSPISELPVTATLAHKSRVEFYLDLDQVERALEDSIQLPYNTKPIPVGEFGNEEITTYAFGEHAGDYGEFLRNAGINEMPIWLVSEGNVNQKRKPFARKLWFDCLDYRSELNGYCRSLSYDFRLAGVRKDAKGITKNLVPKKTKKKEKLIFINPFEVEYKD